MSLLCSVSCTQYFFSDCCARFALLCISFVSLPPINVGHSLLCFLLSLFFSD